MEISDDALCHAEGDGLASLPGNDADHILLGHVIVNFHVHRLHLSGDGGGHVTEFNLVIIVELGGIILQLRHLRRGLGGLQLLLGNIAAGC